MPHNIFGALFEPAPRPSYEQLVHELVDIEGRKEGDPIPDDKFLDTPSDETYKWERKRGCLRLINTLSQIVGIEPTGWKFHLSVATDDLPKATAVIQDYVIDNKIKRFKVFAPDLLESGAAPEKAITIYADKGVDMIKHLPQIEAKLVEAGIRPAGPVEHDRPVEGARYSYYRHDGDDAVGEYIGSDKLAELPPEQRYNPRGVPDPYADLRIEPPTAQPDLGKQTPAAGQNPEPKR